VSALPIVQQITALQRVLLSNVPADMGACGLPVPQAYGLVRPRQGRRRL